MLEVKNISCQKGYNLLFQNLSFYLKESDIARIMGDNGSGKTSLLKILAGLGNFESGTITFANNSIKSYEYKEQVLYLGHNSLINPQLTVSENISFLTKLHNINDFDTSILEKFNLQNYANELCYKLSAGQKRKVILLLLFLSKAKLWLLDEPFTALDASSTKIVEKVIQNHCKNGGMCIFTTHQTSNLNPLEINL